MEHFSLPVFRHGVQTTEPKLPSSASEPPQAPETPWCNGDAAPRAELTTHVSCVRAPCTQTVSPSPPTPPVWMEAASRVWA